MILERNIIKNSLNDFFFYLNEFILNYNTAKKNSPWQCPYESSYNFNSILELFMFIFFLFFFFLVINKWKRLGLHCICPQMFLSKFELPLRISFLVKRVSFLPRQDSLLLRVTKPASVSLAFRCPFQPPSLFSLIYFQTICVVMSSFPI